MQNDTDLFSDIYLRDLLLGTLTRLTRGASGNSSEPSVSQDGRYVVFKSSAENLVAGDTNGEVDIFLWDRVRGTTKNLTLGANASSSEPTISGDGRYIAFATLASNLGPTDSDTNRDIYLYDRVLDNLVLVSNSVVGDAVSPSLDSQGLAVVFNARGLGYWQIYAWARNTGTVALISRNLNNQAGNGDSFLPTVSDSGIAFESSADNLVAQDDNDAVDIFQITPGPNIERRAVLAQRATLARNSLSILIHRGASASILVPGGAEVSLGLSSGASLSRKFVSTLSPSGLTMRNPDLAEIHTVAPTFRASPPLTTQPFQDLGIGTREHFAFADVTGDGNPDLSAIAFDPPQPRGIIVAGGDTNRQFTATYRSLAAFSYDVKHGDFNEDGTEDLLIVRDTACNNVPPVLALRLLSSSSAGGLQTETDFPFPGSPKLISVGMFNNDNHLDVLLFTPTDRFDPGRSSAPLMFLGDGNGNLTPSAAPPIPFEGSSPLVADLNGDGKDDFAAARTSDNALVILTNDGNAGVASTQTLPTNLSVDLRPVNLTAGDIDSDGDQDVLLGSQAFLNDGTGVFALGPTLELADQSPTYVLDVNQDGVKDIVQSGSLTRVLISATSPPIESAGGSAILEFRDFNGDTHLDQLVLSGTGVGFLHGDGKGVFGSRATGGPLFVGTEFGDFTSDLRVDAIDGRVLCKGLSGSLFASGESLPTSTRIVGAPIEDFNEDGFLDYVSTGNQSFTVSLGDGTGAFGSALTQALTGNVTGQPRVADVNSDGHQDLTFGFSDGIANRVQTWLGDGTAQFQLSSTLTPPDFTQPILFDSDGDGNLDILTSQSIGDRLSTFIRNQNGLATRKTA